MMKYTIFAALLIIAICASSATATSAKCHPECSWQCDDPTCPAQCHPVCERPKCEVQCEQLAAADCTTKCDPPVCSVRCPKDMCEKDDCPKCETVCNPANCKTTCIPPEPVCTPMCEATNCNWSCSKPTLCPKPQCSLQCEAPSCEAPTSDSDGTQDHCCPCEGAFLETAVSMANAKLNSTTPASIPSFLEVSHTMKFQKANGASHCCPCH